jgi:hypothetical protein
MSRHQQIRIEDSEEDNYELDDYQVNNHRNAPRESVSHQYRSYQSEEPMEEHHKYSRNQPEVRESYNPHAYNTGLGDEDEDYLNFKMPEPEPAPLTARELKKLNKPEPIPRATKAAIKRAEKAAVANMDPENEPPKKIPANKAGEHQSLMLTLQRYAASQRFAGLIANAGVKLTNLESKTLAELKVLQVRVRTICSAGGGSAGVVSGGIVYTCGVAEAMIPKRFADLEGMGESLQADPEFQLVSEMIELDLGFASSMTPMQRMGLCLSKHAYATHKMNRGRDAVILKLMEKQAEMRQAAHPVPVQQPVPVAQEAPLVQSNTAPVPTATQPIRSRAMPMYE